MTKKRIHLVYETVEGHTATVSERIARSLEETACEVEVARCGDTGPEALAQSDGIIVGGSIHAGKHNSRVVSFAGKNADLLSSKPSAFFIVCLTARSKKQKDIEEVNRYMESFHSRTGWKPDLERAFAGALLYTSYGFIKRKILSSISAREGGDTDTSRDFVYTDWDEVEKLANDFNNLIFKVPETLK
ncbi:MAG: flavodoxin domain-containing protein [Polyangia bacterium]